MAVSFHSPCPPGHQPSLAELVDNIRRNLEGANVPIRAELGLNQFRDARFGPVCRNSVRNCPLRNHGSNCGCDRSPADRIPESDMRPRRFSRGAGQDGTPSGVISRQMGRPGDFGGPLGDGGYAGKGGPASPGICEGPRSPGSLFSVQNCRSPLPEDVIARELAMAGCNYGRGGSHPPSEVASEETYDIVESLNDDLDLENEAWSVVSD